MEYKGFSRLFAEEEESFDDCCQDCDMFDVGYRQGYKDGFEDGLNDNCEEYEEDDYERIIEIDAINLNTIEELKDEIRHIALGLYHTECEVYASDLWDVIEHLTDLEKDIAGEQVLDYYRNR